MSKVYVLDRNGQPLMPTKRSGWVYRALRDGKAKVVSKCPFTIKLLYESTSFTQPLTLGVDTGSKYVGSAVINDVTSEIIYEPQTELRDDIKSKMDRRRQFRRTRRNKLRYRPKRFNNRKASKRNDRYAPTLISKFQGHTREIEFIKSILPVNDIVLEVGEFDPQLLQDPTLAYRKWGYAKGELYQQGNFKQAAKARDDYKCQCCGKRDCRLEVHHLLPRSMGGSDKLANLVTLCSDCHNLAHSTEEQLLVFQKKFGRKAKDTLKYATQMNVLRHMLQREYPATIIKTEPKEWEKIVVSKITEILVDNGFVANDSGEYYSKEVGVVNVIVFPPTITDLTMRICLLHYITKKDVYYAEFTEENNKELLDKFDSYLKELPKTFLSMDEIISSVSDYASKYL